MSEQKKPENNGFLSKIWNGLEAAIFGSGSFPGLNFGLPGHQQVSQANPLFDNLRWYFVSNWRQQLSEAYCELGIIQTIVDVPVEDAFRGGIEIYSKIMTPEMLQKLQDCVERQGDIPTLSQANKWKRLFGGGGLVILTDQDPSSPLDKAALFGKKLEFVAVDMWELYYDMQNTDGFDEVLQDESFEYYSYYGVKLHKSRVIKMKGIHAPSFLRPRLRGWGLSVVEIMVRSVNQYLKGTNLIYELLDEAKIDVYGIAELTNTLLSEGGTQAVAARIQLANRQKNFQHALVMDAKDTYTQKTLTFSGLADVMKEVRYQLASDLRMPLTKLFGMGAVGLNASSEDDIEVYNGMVESSIRTPAKRDILQVLELRCCQLFGSYPEDLSIAFQPLRLMSAEQEQANKSKKFDRLSKSLEQGAITLEEFREACNKDDLLEIQLDPKAQLGADSEAAGKEGEEGGKSGGAEEGKDGADAAAGSEGGTSLEKGAEEGSGVPGL